MSDASNKSSGGVRAATPGDPRPLLARAQQLQASGRIDEAISVYRGLLLQQPAQAEALFLLGTALARKGDNRNALDHLTQAAALRPGSADFQHGLGLQLMRMKQLPEAIACLRKAVAARPDLAVLHNNLGTALRRSGDLDGALACWRTAFKLKRSLDAPPSDQETFAVVSRTKLRHDIDQLRYLRDRGRLPAQHDATIDAYEKVLASLPDGPSAPAFFRLGREHRQMIGATYNRAINLLPMPEHETAAVNPHLPAREIEAAYAASGPGIIHVDNLLTPRAVADLRRFCLESTIWYDFKHEGGYLGAYINEGFDCGLLLQIADELPKALPAIFANYRLTQMWAYKYDSKLEGIGLHADAAAINVNFWITPDAANLDPEHGGLVVYDREAPADWDFAKFNNNLPAIRQFLGESGSRPVTVPYRQNRAVIFNSDLFHNTDRFTFAPGYENRRINITMLFGERQQQV